MLVYLKHEKHGTHIAYDEEEVKRCEANGWKLKDESKDLEALNDVINAVRDEPLMKKRGRPKKAD